MNPAFFNLSTSCRVGQIELRKENYSNAMYLISLIVNNKEIISKKGLITE